MLRVRSSPLALVTVRKSVFLRWEPLTSSLKSSLQDAQSASSLNEAQSGCCELEKYPLVHATVRKLVFSAREPLTSSLKSVLQDAQPASSLNKAQIGC